MIPTQSPDTWINSVSNLEDQTLSIEVTGGVIKSRDKLRNECSHKFFNWSSMNHFILMEPLSFVIIDILIK